jgi:hypothetical protein
MKGARRYQACAADAKIEAPLQSGQCALLVVLILRLFRPHSLYMFREAGGHAIRRLAQGIQVGGIHFK